MCLQSWRLQTQDCNAGTTFQGPLVSVTVPSSAVHSQEDHFSDETDNNERVHITIQRGRSLPNLKRCTSCCSNFHCPFCSPALCRPTKLSKIRIHLENHFNRAVPHEGYTIHRCGLGCRNQLHYHCVHCQSTLSRKSDFKNHLGFCSQKHKASIQPDPAQTDASNTTSSATATTTTPCTMTKAHLPAPTTTTALTPSPTVTASAPEPPDTQVKRLRVKPVLQIQCPICQILLNKRNLKKHIERKHSSRHKDVIASSQLHSEGVDPENGLYTVDKSLLSACTPQQSEGWEEDQQAT